MVKYSYLFFMFLFVIIGVSFISSINCSKVSISEGKNYVVLNVTDPFYVSTLIRMNPSLESVSFNKDNQTLGYINLFGGIGTDFVIEDNFQYEFIAKEDFELKVP